MGISTARTLGVVAVVAACPGLASGQALGSPDGQPDPVSYSLNARWTPSNRLLAATETVRVRDDGPGSLPLVWLRLWPNDSIPGEADGCQYPRLTIQRVTGASVARYAVACSAVALKLPVTLTPGRTALFSLQFRVRAPTYDALFGRSAGIDLFGRAVPTLAVRDTRGWHLDPDSGTGDPAYTLTAAWQVRLQIPAALNLASTGAKLSNTIDAHSGERVVVAYTPHARDFGFAIGRLSLLTATVSGTAIKVFYPSGTSRAVATGALDDAVSAFRRYLNWYGPYDDSHEYDVVLTKLGPESQELPGIVFTNPGTDYIAHETAHMWFYSIVGNDQYREPWLDESFAAWNEEQFAPGSYPCDLRDPLGGHRGGLTLGLSYYENRPNQYTDVVYRGGSCALTALARMLGRRGFLALLRQEVARYRYRVIHTSDFMSLLARSDPGVAARWANLVGIPL